MKIIKIDQNNYENIKKEIVATLKVGGVVVLPFDTVYGFLCDAINQQAIDKIYKIKGRDFSKPLGVVVSDILKLNKITKAANSNAKFIRERVPGPFTFLLPLEQKSVVDPRCCKDGIIGIRIPENNLVLEVAAACDSILAQTSANKAGAKNTANLDEFLNQISEADRPMIDLAIDGGAIENSTPSTIYDLTENPPKRIERN